MQLRATNTVTVCIIKVMLPPVGDRILVSFCGPSIINESCLSGLRINAVKSPCGEQRSQNALARNGMKI